MEDVTFSLLRIISQTLGHFAFPLNPRYLKWVGVTFIAVRFIDDLFDKATHFFWGLRCASFRQAGPPQRMDCLAPIGNKRYHNVTI